MRFHIINSLLTVFPQQFSGPLFQKPGAGKTRAAGLLCAAAGFHRNPLPAAFTPMGKAPRRGRPPAHGAMAGKKKPGRWRPGSSVFVADCNQQE